MLTETQIKQAMKSSGVSADIDGLGRDDVFSENGLDSLDLFNLFVELENVTGETVPDDDVENLNSIQDILDYFNKS